MFLFSIILGGYGLWRLFAAANIASDWYSLYDNVHPTIESKINQFKAVYSKAYWFLNFSGIVFVFGISFLLLSGLLRISIYHKEFL